jgi:hypothetical protein
MNKVIKLQPLYRQGKYDRMPHKVPYLRLSGKWLSEAGFQHSTLVNVEVRDGRMVITSIEK